MKRLLLGLILLGATASQASYKTGNISIDNLAEVTPLAGKFAIANSEHNSEARKMGLLTLVVFRFIQHMAISKEFKMENGVKLCFMGAMENLLVQFAQDILFNNEKSHNYKGLFLDLCKADLIGTFAAGLIKAKY